MTELHVIEGDFESTPYGELNCTQCGCQGFRLRFDRKYECFNVACYNCQHTYEAIAWASSADLSCGGE